LLLAACGPAASPSPTAPSLPTATPTLPAAITPPPTLIPATPRPDLSVTSVFSSDALGLRFDYPSFWTLQTEPEEPADILLTSFDPASPPHKLEWDENTVRISFREVPADESPETLAEYLQEWGGHADAAGLTIIGEEEFFIGKGLSAAHLVLVSGSGGKFEFVYFILAPHHIEVGVEGNFVLAKRVLDTVRSCGPC